MVGEKPQEERRQQRQRNLKNCIERESWKLSSNSACYRHCLWSNQYKERQRKRKSGRVDCYWDQSYFSLFRISLTLHFILEERRTFINRFSHQLMQQFVTIRPPSSTFHGTKQLALNTSAMKLLVVSSVAGCDTVTSLSSNAYDGPCSELQRPVSEVATHLQMVPRLTSGRLLALYAFMVWTGKNLPSFTFHEDFIFSASQETTCFSISRTNWLTSYSQIIAVGIIRNR